VPAPAVVTVAVLSWGGEGSGKGGRGVSSDYPPCCHSNTSSLKGRNQEQKSQEGALTEATLESVMALGAAVDQPLLALAVVTLGGAMCILQVQPSKLYYRIATAPDQNHDS
jgi:hypothetical protein